MQLLESFWVLWVILLQNSAAPLSVRLGTTQVSCL